MAVDPDNIQYTEEYYNSISISGTLKQRRRITASGQINNYNIPDESEIGAGNIRYVNYLGKITKMYIDTSTNTAERTAESAFNKKFPGGEPVLVDSEAKDNSAKLSTSADKAFANANDGCEKLGTLGGLSPALKDIAKQAEEAAGSILSGVAEVAGAVGEAIAAVEEAIGKVTSLIARGVQLVAALIAAGINELAELIDAAINDATSLLETVVNGINEAVGEVAGAVGDLVEEAVDAVGEAITAAGDIVTDLAKAVSAGGCDVVSGALAGIKNNPLSGDAGLIQEKIKSTSPRQSRMLASDVDIQGNPRVRVVNFNIDKSLPFRDLQYKGVLTRMYYQNAADMNERFGIPEGLGSS